jgi:pyruvate/2-oxoglutarate dehydrogenase complex dihydrolipoamide acyltransferase (E2) component
VFDHRILDGAVSAEILSKIKNKLEKFAFDNNENVAQLPAA